MASSEEIRRISEQLKEVRATLGQQTGVLREKLDFKRHATEAMQRHSLLWVTIAGIFGWLLSLLPARKKKIYIQRGFAEKATKGSESKKESWGKSLGARIWDVAWSIAKPALTAYLAHRFAGKGKEKI